MKLLETYRRGKQREADEVAFRRGWMDAIARNASKDAVHYFIAYRSIKWFREQLDKAEGTGEKYITLAELMQEIAKENKWYGK